MRYTNRQPFTFTAFGLASVMSTGESIQSCGVGVGPHHLSGECCENTWKLPYRSLCDRIDLVSQDIKTASQIAMQYRLLATPHFCVSSFVKL